MLSWCAHLTFGSWPATTLLIATTTSTKLRPKFASCWPMTRGPVTWFWSTRTQTSKTASYHPLECLKRYQTFNDHRKRRNKSCLDKVWINSRKILPYPPIFRTSKIFWLIVPIWADVYLDLGLWPVTFLDRAGFNLELRNPFWRLNGSSIEKLYMLGCNIVTCQIF